jgi:hypothetical protein
MKSPATDRLYQLEDDLKAAEKRIAEMKVERDEALGLVERQREHVEDVHAMIDRWIEAFAMTLGEDGSWHWKDGAMEWYDEMAEKYHALAKRWNKLIPKYNAIVASREIGRPLLASEAQCTAVLKLRKAGSSLQDIVDDTSLSLRTVRTIIGRADRTDRTSLKRLQKVDPDRATLISSRARKRTRDALPKQIDHLLAQGASLIQEAKGLGKK